MKVYVTKFALTIGIYSAEVEPPTEGYPGMVVSRPRGPGTIGDHFHGEGREWHRDFASAQAKAEEMRVAKIASLKKQIAKLEKLKFSDPRS